MREDPSLFFSSPGPIIIHASHVLSCPLGQISYAGTKWNSQATYGHASPPSFMRRTPNDLLVYTLEGEADFVDETGLKTVLKPGTLV